MTIPFINDGINEDTEGLYILATVDRVLSDSTDVQEASAIRNGVALIRINDDDGVSQLGISMTVRVTVTHR